MVDESGGGSDKKGIRGNLQSYAKGNDAVFVAEVNTSDPICKICSFVKRNWFSFDVIES